MMLIILGLGLPSASLYVAFPIGLQKLSFYHHPECLTNMNRNPSAHDPTRNKKVQGNLSRNQFPANAKWIINTNNPPGSHMLHMPLHPRPPVSWLPQSVFQMESPYQIKSTNKDK